MQARLSLAASAIVSSLLCVSSPALAQQTQQPPTVPTAPPATPAAQPETPDTPWAVWVAASPSNFEKLDPAAPPRKIDTVVIHDIEGSAISAVKWFQNSQAKASSHYVVDGATGTVYQMVKEHDIAWHAGNGDINGRAIGIEHQGYAYRPGYYDQTLYETSARLVREITTRYNIPRDRTHIFGHSEVPDPKNPGQFGGRSHHRDPGPYWDWDTYMMLVRNDARIDGAPPAFPASLHPGEKATITVAFANIGDDPWPNLPPAAAETDKIALAGRGPLYLGIWPLASQLVPTEPLKDISWISPRLITPPQEKEDIAPGSTAHFSFTVQAPPVAVGPLAESLRLYRVPAAPHPFVGFGPVLPVSLRVDPWDITAGTSSEIAGAFTVDTGWKPSGTAYWQKFTMKPGTTETPAQWSTTLPISGEWDVYVRWPAASGRTAKAAYEVTARDGAHVVLVDQRKPAGDAASGGWHLLGRFPVAGGTGKNVLPVVVRLSAQAPGVAVADSIRFVGPFAPAPGQSAVDPGPSLVGPGARP